VTVQIETENIDSKAENKEASVPDSIVCCLHNFENNIQILKKTDGWGDCQKCTYDPDNNPGCQGYYPIKIITFYVSPNGKE